MDARTTTADRPTRTAPTVRLAALVATLVAILATLATSAPAGAHGPDGDMTVVRAEASGELTISIEVGILYSNDGEPADEAQVTATASSAGTTLDPVDLERTGDAGTATYAGEVEVPSGGQWDITIESTNPASSASTSVMVSDAATTIPTTPDTSASTTTDSTAAPTTAPDDTDGEAAADTDDADDSSNTLLIVVGVIALAALVAAIVALTRNRNPQEPDVPEDPGTPTAGEPPTGP